MSQSDPLEPGVLYADCHKMGGMSKYAYEDDPRRLAFSLARYKHVGKMLEGKRRVLEVGCADGFGSRIVKQHVGHLTAIDLDPKAIDEAKANASERWPITFKVGTINGELGNHYDAVYLLDVLEHIDPEAEEQFLRGLSRLAPVAIIGSPSLESQEYASRLSKAGHINCHSGEVMRLTLTSVWPHVFLFTMNDEGIGTGFLPMAHYLLALCVK